MALAAVGLIFVAGFCQATLNGNGGFSGISFPSEHYVFDSIAGKPGYGKGGSGRGFGNVGLNVPMTPLLRPNVRFGPSVNLVRVANGPGFNAPQFAPARRRQAFVQAVPFVRSAPMTMLGPGSIHRRQPMTALFPVQQGFGRKFTPSIVKRPAMFQQAQPTNIKVFPRAQGSVNQKTIVAPTQFIQGRPVDGGTTVVNAPPIQLGVPAPAKTNTQTVDGGTVVVNDPPVKVGVVSTRPVDGGTVVLNAPPVNVGVGSTRPVNGGTVVVDAPPINAGVGVRRVNTAIVNSIEAPPPINLPQLNTVSVDASAVQPIGSSRMIPVIPNPLLQPQSSLGTAQFSLGPVPISSGGNRLGTIDQRFQLTQFGSGGSGGGMNPLFPDARIASFDNIDPASLGSVERRFVSGVGEDGDNRRLLQLRNFPMNGAFTHNIRQFPSGNGMSISNVNGFRDDINANLGNPVIGLTNSVGTNIGSGFRDDINTATLLGNQVGLANSVGRNIGGFRDDINAAPFLGNPAVGLTNAVGQGIDSGFRDDINAINTFGPNFGRGVNSFQDDVNGAPFLGNPVVDLANPVGLNIGGGFGIAPGTNLNVGPLGTFNGGGQFAGGNSLNVGPIADPGLNNQLIGGRVNGGPLGGGQFSSGTLNGAQFIGGNSLNVGSVADPALNVALPGVGQVNGGPFAGGRVNGGPLGMERVNGGPLGGGQVNGGPLGMGQVNGGPLGVGQVNGGAFGVSNLPTLPIQPLSSASSGLFGGDSRSDILDQPAFLGQSNGAFSPSDPINFANPFGNIGGSTESLFSDMNLLAFEDESGGVQKTKINKSTKTSNPAETTNKEKSKMLNDKTNMEVAPPAGTSDIPQQPTTVNEAIQKPLTTNEVDSGVTGVELTMNSEAHSQQPTITNEVVSETTMKRLTINDGGPMDMVNSGVTDVVSHLNAELDSKQPNQDMVKTDGSLNIGVVSVTSDVKLENSQNSMNSEKLINPGIVEKVLFTTPKTDTQPMPTDPSAVPAAPAA